MTTKKFGEPMSERRRAQIEPGTFIGCADDDEGVSTLLPRLHQGDTGAVGDFISRYGPVIRAYYRRRIGRSMQRLVDSQDLLSTIARRLCQRVSNGRLAALDRQELWALVYRIGDGALVDRMRIIARLRSIEADSSPIVHELRSRLDRPGDRSGAAFAEELSRILASLQSDLDRHLLLMWLQGVPLTEAAADLGIAATLARKRWERIRFALRKQEELGAAS